MSDLAQRWQAALMNNYGTPPLALVRGRGAEVWDADGRRYLDLVSGIAVNALGHAHPAVLEAVTAQLAQLGHVSNLYLAEPPIALAEKLAELLDAPARALFCNSGAEANEAAFKIARRTGRPNIIAAENAFHGRTMGALALTGQQPKRTPFEPMTPGVTHVPYGDLAALDAAVDADTAAVFLEPILGEAGAVTPPPGYLAGAREITAARGALLVLDEVQTGIGRTGSWFAFQQAGIVPDVVTLAKGLGGGLPIGACLGLGRGRRPARTRPARHHVRGQPGVLRGGAGRAAHDRRRRAARARHAGRQGAGHRRRGAGAPAGAPGRRGRAAARHRAHRAGVDR